MGHRLMAITAVTAAVVLVGGGAYAAPEPGSVNFRCLRWITLTGPGSGQEGTSAIQPPESRPFTFTVTSAGCATAGTVEYTTISVSADDTDYEPTSGVLAFAAGDPSGATIVVDVYQDAINEPNESFGVLLCAPAGYLKVDDGWATVVVLNDDGETMAGPPQAEAHCSR